MNRVYLPEPYTNYRESERNRNIAVSLYLQRRQRQRRVAGALVALGSYLFARQVVPASENPIVKTSLLQFESEKKSEQAAPAKVAAPAQPVVPFGVQRDIGAAIADEVLYQQSRGVYESNGRNSGPIVDTYTANNAEEWCVDFAVWTANAVGVNIPNRSQGGPADTDGIEMWAARHPSQFELLILNDEQYFQDRYPDAQRTGPDVAIKKGDFVLTKSSHVYDVGSWHINTAVEDSAPGDIVHTVGGNVANQISNDDMDRGEITTVIRIRSEFWQSAGGTN